MRRLSLGRLASILLPALAIVLLPSVGRGQAKPDRVLFESFDKAELRGDFYPSDKGKKAPTALLLHKLGGNRKQLAPMAEKLQSEGFAVLTFDFRGHGDSTGVGAEFWKHPTNMNQLRVAKGKESIDFKQFPASYYAHLVNDVNAAKFELKKRNNGEECNVGDLVIIGFEDGATLGAIWMGTEIEHKPLVPNMMGFPVPGEPEVKDIAAGVWVSPRSTVGPAGKTASTSLRNTFGMPVIQTKVAHLFIYGAEDANSKSVSDNIFKNMLRADAAGFKMPTRNKAIKDNKLVGHDLLDKNDGAVETAITKDYLKELVFEKRAATSWAKRDIERNGLVEIPRTLISKYGITAP